MVKFSLLVSSFIMSLFIYAQNNNQFTDKLNISKESIEQVNSLNKECFLYYEKGEVDTMLAMANKALQFSQNLNYTYGIGQSNKNLALAYYALSKNDEALYYSDIALKIAIKLIDEKLESDVKNIMGNIYESIDDYEKALHFHFEALNIREKINDIKGIASSYNNIGILYYNQNYLTKSLEYHKKSLDFRIKTTDNFGIATSFNNMALVYFNLNNLDSAIHIYKRALRINKKFNYLNGIALNTNNLGQCFQRLNQYDSALIYHLESLTANEEMKNKKGMALASYNIGLDYLTLNELEKAIQYADQSLKYSKESNSLYNEGSAYKLFANIFEAKKDFRNALVYSRKDLAIIDSIYNIESQRNMVEINTRYETEKKDKEIIKLENEKKVKQLEIDQQKSQKHILFIILIAFLSVLAILGLFILLVKKTNAKLALSNQMLHKKNLEIEHKTKEINSQAIQIAKYQSQMNPHFIFNAINGIQGMVLDGDKIKAVDQIQSFARLLRLTLNNSENEYLSLRDEIDYLNKYVQFELHTFSNKFGFKCLIDPKINLETKIPTMLIQPMVENAIKYGHLETIPDAEICITFNLTQNKDQTFIEVSIRDNGKGMGSTSSTHSSKGINITKHRIQLELKKRQYEITEFFKIQSPIQSLVPKLGTEVSFILPYLK
jgi:sensor histidine kinase YesM